VHFDGGFGLRGARGGTLTLWLVPYVESIFRAYVADFCRYSGKGVGARSYLMNPCLQYIISCI
jgi:hypothetical protein